MLGNLPFWLERGVWRGRQVAPMLLTQRGLRPAIDPAMNPANALCLRWMTSKPTSLGTCNDQQHVAYCRMLWMRQAA